MSIEEQDRAYEEQRLAIMPEWKAQGPNYIPRPMLHPYGKHWTQPDPNNILVDDTHALMTQADFNQLSDYTQSQPSGVYEGKMWKVQDFIHLRGGGARRLKTWYLRWFGVADEPTKCSNNCRVILIV